MMVVLHDHCQGEVRLSVHGFRHGQRSLHVMGRVQKGRIRGEVCLHQTVSEDLGGHLHRHE